jgi:hypothetical protein
MKIAQSIKTYPWLFAGLSALPSCLLIAMFMWLIIFGKRVDIGQSAIPDWAWFAACASLPVFVSITGFTLAYCLSFLIERYSWLTTSHLTRAYLFLFALIWNVVFGFLSFFVFAMGLGDAPVITSMEDFTPRFFGVLCYGYPEAVLISLLVCSVATAIVVAISEAAMAWLK